MGAVVVDSCSFYDVHKVHSSLPSQVLVPIIIFAYWFVALPLAYHLAFVRSGGTTDCNGHQSFCGIVGLVGGMTMGTWTHFILLGIYCAFMIDWRLEAKLAKDRLDLERDTTDYRSGDNIISTSCHDDDVSLTDLSPVKALDI